MITQLFGGGSAGGTGTTIAGNGLGAYMQNALGGAATFGALLQQAYVALVPAGSSASFGGTGVWGLGASANGAVLVTSNALTSEITFIEVATGNFSTHAGSGAAVETSVAVFTH
jgi:hypothetical protein